MVQELKNNFYTQVDVAINKSNGWLSFWIGIISIVIGLSSFWQIYRQSQSEKNIRLQKIENERSIERSIREIKKESQKLIGELKKDQEGLRKNIQETKISSLMMCLSSFPDPQMTLDSKDKRRQIYVLMKNLESSFMEYVRFIEEQDKNESIDREGVFIILVNLKLAIVRTHGVYSDIHQNIKFSQIISSITRVNEDILNGKSLKDLPQRLQEIANLLNGLIILIDRH